MWDAHVVGFNLDARCSGQGQLLTSYPTDLAVICLAEVYQVFGATLISHAKEASFVCLLSERIRVLTCCAAASATFCSSRATVVICGYGISGRYRRGLHGHLSRRLHVNGRVKVGILS